MSNPDNILRVALCAHHFGQRPSDLIEIDSAPVALDFDLACSYELFRFDNKRDFKKFKNLMFGLQTIAAGALGGEDAVKELLAKTEAEDQIDEEEKEWET